MGGVGVENTLTAEQHEVEIEHRQVYNATVFSLAREPPYWLER